MAFNCDVFQISLAVVKGVSVFVVALHTFWCVHNNTVHVEVFVGFSFADCFKGIPATLTLYRFPAVTVKFNEPPGINDGDFAFRQPNITGEGAGPDSAFTENRR